LDRIAGIVMLDDATYQAVKRDPSAFRLKGRIPRHTGLNSGPALASLVLSASSEGGTVRVVVEFDWEEFGQVGLLPTGRLAIPIVPAKPGIYRFRVMGDAGTEVYIGETDNLRRRMQGNYASTHTGATNVRVRELLLTHLRGRGIVSLAVVRAASFEVDGHLMSADLSDRSARLLVENAALAIARLDSETIHNL
jgi:hypothetical protein